MEDQSTSDQSRVDRHFAEWRVERTIPAIRVGMAAAFVAGWVLIAVGAVADRAFTVEFLPAVVISSVGFVVAIGATAPAFRHLVHSSSVMAVLVWGAAVGWAAHQRLGAPEVATSGLILTVLFGFQVFRIPTAMLAPAAVGLAVLHSAQLHWGASEDVAGGVPFHHAVGVLVVGAGVLVGRSWDAADRAAYERERTIARQRADLELERSRAERLLRSMLPDAVADALKRSPGTLVEHHDGVSVLFADVVGFTQLTERLHPKAVIELLDDVFGLLDAAAATFGVEKIRTVGDAYMAATGAPTARDDHLFALADFAIAVRDGLPARRASVEYGVQLRMGLATGDAVAGVIGRKRMAYDLWSATVNMAARMESHGTPGLVQVDGETADRLAEAFVLEERGVVPLKGIGPTRTFYLLHRSGHAGGDRDQSEELSR